MRYETVTVQECLNMYHIKGKRTILHNGKVLGFQKEKADKLGKDFERRTAARIVKLGIAMNQLPKVYTHVLIHGDTGCLCVIVYENGTQVYENRVFLSNKDGLRKIVRDMKIMRKEARRSER